MKKQKTVNKTNKKEIECETIFAPADVGLTSEQVKQRVEDGFVNKVPKRVTKSYAKIFYDNLINFFNILLFAIFILMCTAKYWEGMFFMVILVANITIGLIQDIRARKLVDQLRVVINEKAVVIRDGKEIEIDINDIVLNDIVVLKAGDQISADGQVIEGHIDVNEALLTGESENIEKNLNDEVFSGTYVTSGKAKIRIMKVGKSNFAEILQENAKTFKRPKSQILRSLNSIFKVVGIIVIIVGTATIITYWVNHSLVDHYVDSVKSISGSLITMIPSGMYLLTSLTLAVGVIRLARHRMLVQELYCIESLARVDTLCFDKTGTLTDGSFTVYDVLSFCDATSDELKSILYTLVCATEDTNSTANAIKEAFVYHDKIDFTSAVAFSSETKYSAVMLSDGRAIALGAEEFVGVDLKDIQRRIDLYTNKGLRVLVIASSKQAIKKGEKLHGLIPIGLLILEDAIRRDAIENINWFQSNGVNIKVISGDNINTVRQIAMRCGILNANKAISLEGMSLEEVRKIANEYTVFARVNPEQKEAIIAGLHDEDHIVAMTGDGVNDILALRSADCSIAMADGAAAARNASYLVALDSNFSSLPKVVAEGRRVINNLQRTCSLFLTKTIFAITMSVAFLVASWFNSANRYPFSPQNMYLWEFLTIGMASFFLALQPNEERLKDSFLSNIFTMTIPAGITQIAVVSVYFILEAVGVMPHDTATTYAMISFTAMSIVVLYRISFPFDVYRLILSIAVTIIAPILFLFDYHLTGLAHIEYFDDSFILAIKYSEIINVYDKWWIALVIFGGCCVLYVLLDFVFYRIKNAYVAKKEAKN